MTFLSHHNDTVAYDQLQAALELKYGPAVAQDIIDQIKKADAQDNAAEYMPIKAASEVVEIMRSEVKTSLLDLKFRKGRSRNIKSASNDNTSIEYGLASKEKAIKSFRTYMISQHIYYRLYHKAMAAYPLALTAININLA